MIGARLGSLRNGEGVIRLLGVLGWVVIAVAGVIATVSAQDASADVDQPVVLAAIVMLVLIWLVRIGFSAVVWPSRRLAFGALTVGLILWYIGSTILNAATPASGTTFPAPGEGFFLASYFGFAAFLVLDAATRNHRAETAWLDAVIMVGGVAAVAGALLLTPVASNFPEGGVPLLVALIYPLLDLAMALVVVGQWALDARQWNRRTVVPHCGLRPARRRRHEPGAEPGLRRVRLHEHPGGDVGRRLHAHRRWRLLTPSPPGEHGPAAARRLPHRVVHRRHHHAAAAPAGRARLGDRSSRCHHPPGHRCSARGGPARVARGGRGLPARPDRRSDGTAQPPGSPEGPRRRNRSAAAAGPDAARPRRVQGGQRHSRAQCWRHPARARGPPHARVPPPRDPAGEDRRGRVRDPRLRG